MYIGRENSLPRIQLHSRYSLPIPEVLFGHLPFLSHEYQTLSHFTSFFSCSFFVRSLLHMHIYSFIYRLTDYRYDIILNRKEMVTPTNSILTGLAVADMLVMVDYIPYTIHNYIRQDRPITELYTYGWAIFALFHAHFSVICHTISTWLTVLLAVWRYIAVR